MPTFTTTVSARDRRDPEARATVDVTYEIDEGGDVELASVIVDEPTVQKGMVDILNKLYAKEWYGLFEEALEHMEKNK